MKPIYYKKINQCFNCFTVAFNSGIKQLFILSHLYCNYIKLSLKENYHEKELIRCYNIIKLTIHWATLEQQSHPHRMV